LLLEVLGAKRLGLLRELVPAATLIAVLLNPTEPTFDTQLNDVQEAARAVGQQIYVLRASTEREVDAAFTTAKDCKPGRCSSAPAFYTSSSASKSSRWRRAPHSRRSTVSANTCPPAG
jgi:ABC-type uncharacterized transport system substrate-binding protein